MESANSDTSRMALPIPSPTRALRAASNSLPNRLALPDSLSSLLSTRSMSLWNLAVLASIETTSFARSIAIAVLLPLAFRLGHDLHRRNGSFGVSFHALALSHQHEIRRGQGALALAPVGVVDHCRDHPGVQVVALWAKWLFAEVAHPLAELLCAHARIEFCNRHPQSEGEVEAEPIFRALYSFFGSDSPIADNSRILSASFCTTRPGSLRSSGTSFSRNTGSSPSTVAMTIMRA